LPHLEFANRYAEEYFGIPSEVIAGDRWIELVHPDDRAGVRVAWEASRATGQDYCHVHHLRMADGHYRRFLAEALPLRGERGEVLRWCGVLTPLDPGAPGPRLRGPQPRPPRSITTRSATARG
jgi:PAS domain-containing protein